MTFPITPHFDVGEFRCHDGTEYPAEWIATRLRPLCVALEVIRAECGHRAVTILSGYRTEAHNAALRDADGSGSGVAKNSQHIQGRAADITVEGMAPSDVHATVLRLVESKQIAIGGLGLYRGWIHVDIRERPEDGHLAVWNGPGVA